MNDFILVRQSSQKYIYILYIGEREGVREGDRMADGRSSLKKLHGEEKS